MKRPWVFILVAAASATAAAADGTFDRGAWTHLAGIDLPSDGKQGGYAELALTPEVFDLARPDLADLRVVSGKGTETAYALRAAEGREERIPVEASLVNPGCIPGQSASVTADFGKKVLKNRVEIYMQGTNFRRAVLLEGSDDGAAWQVVQAGVFLFRVTGEAGSGAFFDKNFVALPPNDQRYLRVTVSNGQGDPDCMTVSGVKAWQVTREPPETAAVPVTLTRSAEKGNLTRLSLDAGLRNLPLYALTLKVSGADFYRTLRVSGRNETVTVVKKTAEGDAKRAQEVEVPWTPLTSSVVYRFTSGTEVEESVSVFLGDGRFRYLRVDIENGSDKPLDIEGATLDRLVYRLGFKAEPGEVYKLYAGKPDAAAPSYDIVHFVDKLRAEGARAATLGKLVPNPDRTVAAVQAPFSERHKGILWGALIAVVAVLSILVYRMTRRQPPAG